MSEWDERALEVAGDWLFKRGLSHGWWSKDIPSFAALDPIGREEFLDIVAGVLAIYYDAAASGPAVDSQKAVHEGLADHAPKDASSSA